MFLILHTFALALPWFQVKRSVTIEMTSRLVYHIKPGIIIKVLNEKSLSNEDWLLDPSSLRPSVTHTCSL